MGQPVDARAAAAERLFWLAGLHVGDEVGVILRPDLERPTYEAGKVVGWAAHCIVVAPYSGDSLHFGRDGLELGEGRPAESRAQLVPLTDQHRGRMWRQAQEHRLRLSLSHPEALSQLSVAELGLLGELLSCKVPLWREAIHLTPEGTALWWGGASLQAVAYRGEVVERAHELAVTSGHPVEVTEWTEEKVLLVVYPVRRTSAREIEEQRFVEQEGVGR